MHNPVFEVVSQSPRDRVTAGVAQLYSLARMGAAASDSAMSVDLQKDGYSRHFEVMAEIADGLFEEIERLQDKPEANPDAAA